MKEENIIDLSKAKIGDSFLTKSGVILKYIRLLTEINNPNLSNYKYQLSNESFTTTYTSDGRRYDFDTDPMDIDSKVIDKHSVTKDINKSAITSKVEEIESMLLEKNLAYGDSALNGVSIFSKGKPSDSICARIDDKLARIKNSGLTDATEDTVKDLCGYLVLLLIALDKEECV